MGEEKEVRQLRGRELRVATNAAGQRTASGYAAVYNSLSDDLGGFREKVAPGAFSRSLREQPDVYCLYAHSAQVLGRTKAGTLTLSQDARGLRFEAVLPDTSAARDVAASIERGDVDGCSFGFFTRADAWEETTDGALLRTLEDVDLLEISITPMPAYPATTVSLRSAPAAIRARLTPRLNVRATVEAPCTCGCPQCAAGACGICSADPCDASGCLCNAIRFRRAADGKKTKRVDGEDLTADCFLIVLDPEKTDTWKLPWKFSTDAKTESHLRNALARFDQLEDVPQAAKAEAWTKLVALCKQYGIEVGDEDRARRPKVRADDGSGVCDCPCLACQNGYCADCDCDGCGSDGCTAEDCECGEDIRMKMRLRVAQARARG